MRWCEIVWTDVAVRSLMIGDDGVALRRDVVLVIDLGTSSGPSLVQLGPSASGQRGGKSSHGCAQP